MIIEEAEMLRCREATDADATHDVPMRMPSCSLSKSLEGYADSSGICGRVCKGVTVVAVKQLHSGKVHV